MTYSEFRSMLCDATEFTNIEDFIFECGGGFPAEFAEHDLDYVRPSIDFVFAYAREKSFRSIIDFLGISLASYARETGIPLRTVESWSSEDRTPPEYLLDLLACNAVEEMLK